MRPTGDDPDRSPSEANPQNSTRNQPTVLHKLPSLYKGGLEEQDYEFIGLLGQGGMGTVEKVKNTRLNRIEARKTIAKEVLGEDALLLFQGEIKANARLRHPNIVVIYGAGMSQEFGLFFTMEYVEGGDLGKLIDQQFPARVLSGDPKPPTRKEAARWPREAARLLKRVVEAVEHMHQREVWHRDLKPTNILIGDDGNPKVTDFGLAVFKAELSSGFRTGGTVGYMSPEQAKLLLDAGSAPAGSAARPFRPDPDFYRRGDIYSLGAVLYEMLTGRPPYPTPADEATVKGISDSRKRTEEILKTVVDRNKEIPPPRQLNPRVPRRLEAICMKCLARNPKDRYPTAARLAQDLDDYLRPFPWLVVGLLSVVVLLGLAVAWSVLRNQADHQRWIAERITHAKAKEEEAREKKGQESVDLLNRAREALLQVRKEAPASSRDLEFDITRLSLEIGKGYSWLRDYPLAKKEFHTVLERFEQNPREYAEDRWHQLFASAYHWDGVAWQSEQKLEPAREQFEKALKAWRRLADDHPNNRLYQRYLARAYGYLGDVELELGLKEDAARSYARSLRLRTELARGPDASTEDRYQLARSQWNTGYFAEWNGDFDRALKAHQERKRSLDEIHEPPPNEEFVEDRPSCLTTIAELQLLLRDGRSLDPAGILASLKEAEKDRPSRDLRARILVARGNCNAITGQRELARKDLNEAIILHRQMIREGVAQASDYYRLAQAHALLSRLAEDSEKAGYHEVAAVICLETAVSRGYGHLRKVERDPVFHRRLRARDDFTLVLNQLTETRKGP